VAPISRASLRSLVQPAVRWWDRVPIRVQGRITVALPLVAVLVSAGFAFLGNQDRVAIETDIQRKFEMSGSLGDLTTLMVNAETGMRGYLLTGRTEFLQPFDQASAAQPGAIARLTELAAAEPGAKPRADKLARVAELRDLTGRQLADLAGQRAFVSAGRLTVPDEQLRSSLANGKDLMDRIRGDVDAMQDEERGLLDDRIADINAIRVRDYVSVALALVTALATRFLAWYLFRNGTLNRVERLTEIVRSRRSGTPAPDPLPVKRDKMGELEREVHLLADGVAPAVVRTPD
jgi:CHASE3 domain sensor protein